MRFRKTETTSEKPEDSALHRRFERKVRLSWLALLAERIWEALLWPFLVVALFLVVSLVELWSLMLPLLHRVVLGAFGIGLLVSFLPLVRIKVPTRLEALRRLEKHANIKHRPATSYEDRLGATPPKETVALWAAHRERLSRLIPKLKPSWPAPRTDRMDPYALRAAILLVLVAAVLAAGGDVREPLRAAFSPVAAAAPALLRLDAWVTPPIYTGIAPIVLADGSEPVGAGAESFRALSVPERSELIVRTHAPQGEKVTLATSNEDGSGLKVIEPKTGGTQGLIEFNVALNEPLSADVRIGGETVSKWRFDLIKDEPPTINLMGNPTATPRGALRLVYRAEDDHGVASAEARFALPDGQDVNLAPASSEPGAKADSDPLLQPPTLPLQLPHANAKRVDGRATQDLTAHPWAGLKVRMTLVARDQAGQEGKSAPYEFILPERKFTKPLAKAVVEQRKKLVRDPSSSDVVARALEALTLGEDKVIDDSFVYLSLRDAYWRLHNDDSRQSIASVVDQLWDVALRIEDGDLPEAERNVKAAQDALSEALKENAEPEEIKRLVDELRDALSRYLQALASQQQNKGNMPEQAQQQNGDQLVSQQDLDKLLKNIENLAQSGSKDLAERMLSELKDILDRLQTGNFADNPQQQRAGRMMKDLGDLVSKQQKLLDDTFKAKRDQGGGKQADQFNISPPGQPMEFGPGIYMSPFGMPQENSEANGQSEGSENSQGRSATGRNQARGGRQQQGQRPGQFDELSKQQGDLREQLQSMIDRLHIEGATSPEQFKDAGDAMGRAQEAMRDSNLDQATEEQGHALDQLRQGAQSLAEQMMENGEAQVGKGQGNSGKDPLGRPDRSNRPDLGLSVKVPDEIDIQRAREVLDELRRRLGDPSRPMIELDYLERLIRPY